MHNLCSVTLDLWHNLEEIVVPPEVEIPSRTLYKAAPNGFDTHTSWASYTAADLSRLTAGIFLWNLENKSW